MNGDARSGLPDFRDLSDEDAARALLDLTLQAAPPDVADAVRACALPAWFDAGLLALLTEKDEREAAALLEQVAAFSFVLPRDGGGYVYHEATRARLRDWWREPQRRAHFAALSERLARHYLPLAYEQDHCLSGPDHLHALTVLDGAYPNIRAAWEGAVASDNTELVRDFACTLADYFQRRGLWADWIAWRQAGLDACDRVGDAIACAGMQNNLGNVYAQLPTGDRAENFNKAIACYREALRVYTPEAAPLDYTMSQNNLGNAYLRLPTGDRAENLRQALEHAEAALRFIGSAPWNRAAYLFTRGLIHLALSHLDQALADYQAAIPLADSVTIAEALEQLDEFAVGHRDAPGLDAVRALLISPP